MKKENLGLELIKTRFEGMKEIWVEVECKDGYFTEVISKTRIEIPVKNSSIHSYETMQERKKELLKKVRKYVSGGEAMVTLMGIGKSSYSDKRDLYRITNRWYKDVEVRPFNGNDYSVHYVKEVDTPQKATNSIMKTIELVFDYVIEQIEQLEK